jgi:hypothetical protein
MEWVAGPACDEEAVRNLQVVPWHGRRVSYVGRECLEEEKSKKSERKSVAWREENEINTSNPKTVWQEINAVWASTDQRYGD